MRLAARADHCALACVDFDISRRVLRRLRPLPRRFHPGQASYYRGVEAEFDALGFRVIAQDDFAVDDIGKAGEFGVGRPAGNMAGSPVFVQIISAVIVFVLVAYVLFVLGSFSFSKTIESVSPSVDVKVVEEKGGDGVEGSLEERCSGLAEDACLTERERRSFCSWRTGVMLVIFRRPWSFRTIR